MYLKFLTLDDSTLGLLWPIKFHCLLCYRKGFDWAAYARRLWKRHQKKQHECTHKVRKQFCDAAVQSKTWTCVAFLFRSGIGYEIYFDYGSDWIRDHVKRYQKQLESLAKLFVILCWVLCRPHWQNQSILSSKLAKTTATLMNRILSGKYSWMRQMHYLNTFSVLCTHSGQLCVIHKSLSIIHNRHWMFLFLIESKYIVLDVLYSWWWQCCKVIIVKDWCQRSPLLISIRLISSLRPQTMASRASFVSWNFLPSDDSGKGVVVGARRRHLSHFHRCHCISCFYFRLNWCVCWPMERCWMIYVMMTFSKASPCHSMAKRISKASSAM